MTFDKNRVMAVVLPLDPTLGKPKKLLEQVRSRLRFKHYSIRTEAAYMNWIRRFILFHGKRHPESMGTEEVRGSFSDLAAKQNVAASTQNQAFSALLFLYRDVLKQELPWIETSNIQHQRRKQ
jgi:Phage integrase, N-terminal SAM-like domain